MKTRTIVIFFLSSLLIACASATPTTRPTAEISSIPSAFPAQTSPAASPPGPKATWTQTSVPPPEAAPSLLPGNDFTLQRFAQTGGAIYGIAIIGDVAYVGKGPRVAAIDISQHDQPQLISQSEPLPGLVTQLLQISGRPTPLLLVNAGKYLVVINLSSPGELKSVHQLELAGAISAMVWDDRANILYAGGSIYQSTEKYTGFISAVGITQDNRLEIKDSVAMPEQPLSLALGKESVFAGAQGYQGGLYHIRVKTPGQLDTPRLVIPSTPERPLQPLRMQVIGDRLYLGCRDVEAYDISNPDQLLNTWTENVGDIVVKDFSLVGEQVYLFGWTIQSDFVRDAITAPEPIAGDTIGETASVTAIHDGDFLVAYRDLEIYDTADPQALQLLGSYQSPVTDAIGAAENENAVFVVDHGVGDGLGNAVLQALSLPDLKPLEQVTTGFPTGGHGFRGIAVDGDRLYLASEDRVWVYGVSRARPTLLGQLEIGGGPIEAITAFEHSGKRLLVVAQEITGSGVLAAYDLTDPQKPIELGTPLTLDRGHLIQMAWNESALYAIQEIIYEPGAVLYMFDLDNKFLSVKESLQLAGYVETMAVDESLIALASTDQLLAQSSISVIEAEPLRILSHTTLPEKGKGAAFIQDMVLVVVGDEYGAAQLLAYEFQDPANPRQVQAIDIPASENAMVPILVTGPYVVLANGSGGVEVLEYHYP